MLAFISVRALIRYLQRLAPRYTAYRGAGPGDSDTTNPQPANESSRLIVGSLEVEGDERLLVSRVLFQKMLQSVSQTLDSLRTILSQQKKQLLQETSKRPPGVCDDQASSSLLHIQQTLQALTNALQALESFFNSHV